MDCGRANFASYIRIGHSTDDILYNSILRKSEINAEYSLMNRNSERGMNTNKRCRDKWRTRWSA